MFELLVPPEPTHLDRVGGDRRRYDEELRPGLMVEAIRSIQAAGVEPDVWKIEGLAAREDCERVAAQARAGVRAGVACVVLGRGADRDQVVRWLRSGRGVPGYIGFAVGRTIWWDAIERYAGGAMSREEAAERIAANYLYMIAVYTAPGA